MGIFFQLNRVVSWIGGDFHFYLEENFNHQNSLKKFSIIKILLTNFQSSKFFKKKFKSSKLFEEIFNHQIRIIKNHLQKTFTKTNVRISV